MALTITIPGAVSTTTGSTAPAVLTVGVGSPGAQGATGATGATGPGVAAGGSAGQVLAKIDGTNYNTEWVNVEGDYLPLAGGAMDTDAEVTIAETTGHDSELAGWGLGVELSADHAQGTTVEYNGLNTYDASGHMIVAPTGLTFPDATVQTTAFNLPGVTSEGSNSLVVGPSSGYNYVKIDAGLINVFSGDEWSVHQTTITGSSISINDNTVVVIDDLAGYAPLASPVFTGDARAPTPATSDNDTSIATTAFVKAQGYVTSSTAPVTSVAGRTGAVTLAVADVSGAAPLASPSLTGTPLSTTASVSTNTTQIATTAFVLGQVGTATPIVNGTAAVGTSLLYARQDHVHGTDTTRAALESPTFSGTPTLPTGTIATTQSPGNNTTALATTAFVTAAVPSFATNAQARQGLSETVTSSPYGVISAMMDPGYRPNLVFSTTTSGTGASVGNSASSYLQAIGPNTAVAGYAIAYTSQYLGLSAGYTPTKVDFSKPFRMGGSIDCFSSTYVGDANNEMKIWFGQANALPPTNYADPTTAAIGWKKTGGAASTFTLMVHNGTSLTTQSSSATLSGSGLVSDWEIRSDGAGNVALFINGTSVATTSAGPTTVQSNVCTLQAVVGQTASAATRILLDAFYTKIWVAPQS